MLLWTSKFAMDKIECCFEMSKYTSYVVFFCWRWYIAMDNKI